MEPAEFREFLRDKTAEEIVDSLILTENPGPFTSMDDLQLLKTKARQVFSIADEGSIQLVVVGSAKLGFSYIEKPSGKNGGNYKPAYRAYDPKNSDIDVAVVSSVLYNQIWIDLARHGATQVYFPWNTPLAPYMLNGWIRPDKFPPQGPRRCDDWRRVVNDVSRLPEFRYKRLRCGIYRSMFFLKLYQQRGVMAAQKAEIE